MEIEPTPQPENTAQTMRAALEHYLPSKLTAAGEMTIFETSVARTWEDITGKIHDAERKAEAAMPVRIKGAAQLQTLDSLIQWANRFSGDDKSEAALFLNNQKQSPSLTAVMNYHAGGAPARNKNGEDARARHADHIGIYEFPVSDAWSSWANGAAKPMTVGEFGAFIEDHAADLIDPTPFLMGEADATDQKWEIAAQNIARKLKGSFATSERMIDLGRTFSVNVEAKARVKTDRQSGAATIVLQEDHTDEEGQELKLPRLFLIAIPVFEQGDIFPIICTFQYRMLRGIPILSYNLFDADAAFSLAIEEAADKAMEKTAAPLFFGFPEQEK